MSKFSGKCDFYDSISIACDGDATKIDEYLANTDIYVYGKDSRKHKVECRNEMEIAKYYPYLTSIGCFDNTSNKRFVVLSSCPFIDTEEKERIDLHVNDAYRYWNKCKRNKKPFVIDEYLETVWSSYKEIDKQIAERIAKDGKKAKFDGIHFPMHEYYRKQWFEELVRLGYSEFKAFSWCFNEFFPSDEVIEKRLGRKINRE